MRSHILARRTRSLVKTQLISHRALISSTHAVRHPRKDRPGSTQTNATPRLSKRSSSSATPSDPYQDDFKSALALATSPPAEPPSDEPPEEKPKRRTRASVASTDGGESPQPLPSGLDIVWAPEDDASNESSSTNTNLPPTEVFQEILHNFHITLHPQTQHRATYVSTSGPLVEPTFALYCPIEGGDAYIDETVRELARQTGADVVVLDAVQLAAGTCGHFGKAASVLQLPVNPLHVPSASKSSSLPAPPQSNEDEDWDDSPFMMPTRMTVHVLTPVPSRQGRSILAASSRSISMSKVKAFFDELINLPAPNPPSSASELKTQPRRPRIVYIRDFPTLAPSSAAWYPALFAAVRQRRQGPISRPTSPVLNPTTIVFGVSPSIVVPPSSSSFSGQPGMVNMLMTRHSSSSAPSGSPTKSTKSEHSEDAAGDKAREKRMVNRLKRWARAGASSEDIPQLSFRDESEDSGRGKPELVVLGGSEGLTGLPSALGSALSASVSGRPRNESDTRTQFFRTSLVVPNARTPSLERFVRTSRRKEINELAMRMAVTAVGGELGKSEPEPPMEEGADQTTPQSNEHRLWEQWGKAVETWNNVRRIADRALGSVIASSRSTGTPLHSLEFTPVPWSAVFDAWAAEKRVQELFKSIYNEVPVKILRDGEEGEEEKAGEDPTMKVDELVERIKRDPELDQHEARLLGSIVDTAAMSTTFSQVHLPEHTIDSIRTIVSLPLLHPAAFQHGLLKEHSMTGCLLFGPPGTGKTLIVRALAKEAGCRMLAITPSDVMDMYVGEGEKLVRAVFSLARKLSPCVVFIDELDALFGARVSRETGGGIAHRGVITEFMQEMDGLKSSKDNVIVIGATNRPFDLDDAVLRRLPRRLLVDLPGEKEREEILKILLRDEELGSDVDLKALAKRTESFSGSDLKHLCVSAALDAVKERVEVPWRPSSNAITQQTDTVASEATAAPGPATDALPVSESLAQLSHSNAAATHDANTTENADSAPSYSRMLSWRNFEKALKEITPSASESLGSLADLRKWNKEFGEGRKRQKDVVWGKGRFGFTIDSSPGQDVGRVAPVTTDIGRERR